jgi:hypothetical protein
MAILGKLDSGFGTERRIAMFASAAARLMNTFATQVEVFRRLRNGGHQYVRVEDVHGHWQYEKAARSTPKRRASHPSCIA